MRVLIFGAGAHGRVILDIVRAQGRNVLVAFVDDNESLWGHEVNGAPVIGDLERVLQTKKQDQEVDRLIVAIGDPNRRLAIAQEAGRRSMSMFNAVHPSAVIMPSAFMGEGNMIGAMAVVNSNVQMGNHMILNTSGVVEHDSVVGDGVTIGPGAQIGGRVVINSAAFIGAGAIILPRIVIGHNAVIAAGSVVTKHVSEGVLVRGVPARAVETVDESFDWGRLL